MSNCDCGKDSTNCDNTLYTLNPCDPQRTAKQMTRMCHPYKMTLDEFLQEISDSIQPFKDNMLHLGNKYTQPSYPEDWLMTFGGWMEMEKV